MGGKAAVRKAPAGKSAKMLDSTEALNLRAKAAFDHIQRQEQRKPAAKRCVQATAAVCLCVCIFKCLAGCKFAVPHCKTAASNCKTVRLHCNILQVSYTTLQNDTPTWQYACMSWHIQLDICLQYHSHSGVAWLHSGWLQSKCLRITTTVIHILLLADV